MGAHQRKPGFLGRLVEERARRGAESAGAVGHATASSLSSRSSTTGSCSRPIRLSPRTSFPAPPRASGRSSRARAIPTSRASPRTSASTWGRRSTSRSRIRRSIPTRSISIASAITGEWRAAGHHDPVVPGLGPEPAGPDRQPDDGGSRCRQLGGLGNLGCAVDGRLGRLPRRPGRPEDRGA